MSDDARQWNRSQRNFTFEMFWTQRFCCCQSFLALWLANSKLLFFSLLLSILLYSNSVSLLKQGCQPQLVCPIKIQSAHHLMTNPGPQKQCQVPAGDLEVPHRCDLSVACCQKTNNLTIFPELSYLRPNYCAFNSRLWHSQRFICNTS